MFGGIHLPSPVVSIGPGVYHGHLPPTPPSKAVALLLIGIAAASCADLDGDAESAAEAVVAGGAAKGAIPAGLPARVLVGLFEDTGATWMKTAACAWDVRYRYFTKGWVNNWGWGAYDGVVGPQLHARVRRAGLHPGRPVLPDERRAGRR